MLVACIGSHGQRRMLSLRLDAPHCKEQFPIPLFSVRRHFVSQSLFGRTSLFPPCKATSADGVVKLRRLRLQGLCAMGSGGSMDLVLHVLKPHLNRLLQNHGAVWHYSVSIWKRLCPFTAL